MKRRAATAGTRRQGTHFKHRQFEALESRLLLSLDGLDFDRLLQADPGIGELHGRAAMVGPAVSPGRSSSSTLLSAATLPLSSLPALSSLPGAAASLYLDFNGHFEAQWGGYRNITIPAFDQDGDPTTFSDGELTTIETIWKSVAEDYAPFKINVTTVQPGSFANGVAMRIAIGGDGAWVGPYGGVSYVDSFTNSITNTAFVFPKNLDNGYWQFVSEASSHEAGHSFGLQHQSSYDAQGRKIAEYYQGPGDGRAPIMGLSYNAVRGLWWNGTSSISATSYQDDMAVIARPANGFGYRSDDHGDTVASATPLAAAGLQVSGAGIIGSTADRDYFSFTTGAGVVNFSLNVPQSMNNLDPVFELRDQADNVLATAPSYAWFSTSISADLPAAGNYRLVVASHGNYGDVGQYAISGTIKAAEGILAAPTNLVATANGSTQISLTWTDNTSQETGYRIERSTNGTDWSLIATMGANVTAYQDTGLAAGTSYTYRIQAFNDGGTSDYSATATATTQAILAVPAAPTNLLAIAASSKRVNLTWQDNSANESGFVVERSTNNGLSWVRITQTGPGVTSYADTTVSARKAYAYRVRAFNGSGYSAYSNVATATTPRAGASASLASAADAVFQSAWLAQSDPELAKPTVLDRSSGGPAKKSSLLIETALADSGWFEDSG